MRYGFLGLKWKIRKLGFWWNWFGGFTSERGWCFVMWFVLGLVLITYGSVDFGLNSCFDCGLDGFYVWNVFWPCVCLLSCVVWVEILGLWCIDFVWGYDDDLLDFWNFLSWIVFFFGREIHLAVCLVLLPCVLRGWLWFVMVKLMLIFVKEFLVELGGYEDFWNVM